METLTEERPAPGVAESPPAPAVWSKPLALLVAMRPQEWIKNLLVFAGLLFSGKLDEGAQVLDATATFAAFCAISSAGYLFNDLRDVVHDRQHPEKRLRPIASGALSVAAVQLSAAALAAIGVAVALIGASAEVAGVVALYGVITAAYSLILKQLVILDVMTIASLFCLRVVAGAVAVEADASEWLLLCTGAGRDRSFGEAECGGGGVADDATGAPALFARLPRPDGGDGDRGGDHELCDLRRQQPPDRQSHARHRALGPVRDLSLPVSDLRPQGHALHVRDPDRGPGDDLRRRHLGRRRPRDALRVRLIEPLRRKPRLSAPFPAG
jgi:hypothetical protein